MFYIISSGKTTNYLFILFNPKNSLGIILDAQKGGFDIVHLIPQPCYP